MAAFLLAAAANIALLIAYFYRSGGAGLARVVWYNLLRDIPDKKYGWGDFIDRGSRQEIKGFYAGGDEKGFYLWALSGLKRFNHKSNTSVYLFNDVCAVVRSFNAGQKETDDSAFLANQVTGDLQEWQAWLNREYLVTVLRLGESEGRNIVDKAFAVSGRYKILDQLTKEQCE